MLHSNGNLGQCRVTTRGCFCIVYARDIYLRSTCASSCRSWQHDVRAFNEAFTYPGLSYLILYRHSYWDAIATQSSSQSVAMSLNICNIRKSLTILTWSFCQHIPLLVKWLSHSWLSATTTDLTSSNLPQAGVTDNVVCAACFQVVAFVNVSQSHAVTRKLLLHERRESSAICSSQ